MGLLFFLPVECSRVSRTAWNGDSPVRTPRTQEVRTEANSEAGGGGGGAGRQEARRPGGPRRGPPAAQPAEPVLRRAARRMGQAPLRLKHLLLAFLLLGP